MILLEKTTEKDMNQIHQIQKSVFERLYNKYKDLNSPFNESLSALTERYNQPNTSFFFIKKENEIIGYIRIVTNNNQTTAKIGPIGIIPKYDNHGFGTKTISLIEDTFNTVKEWSLGTILQEEKLIHFYTKLGYKRFGDIIPIQENMDIVLLSKVIN